MVDITFPLTVPINKILDVLNPRLGLLNSTEVYDALTKMVTESKSKNDLHVSIGEGDFLVSWIRRTCEHHPGKVKIGRLFIACLDDNLASHLEKLGLLRPGFRASMTSNIDLVRTDLAITRENIEVKVLTWPRMPPFHGWLYDGRALIAKWAINDFGHLNVNTMMIETNQSKSPDAYRRVFEMFPFPLPVG